MAKPTPATLDSCARTALERSRLEKARTGGERRVAVGEASQIGGRSMEKCLCCTNEPLKAWIYQGFFLFAPLRSFRRLVVTCSVTCYAPGWRLHALKGAPKGHWAVWRRE